MLRKFWQDEDGEVTLADVGMGVLVVVMVLFVIFHAISSHGKFYGPVTEADYITTDKQC